MAIQQIKSLYRFVANHPLTHDQKIRAMARVVRWQVASLLSSRKRVVPFAGSTRLAVARSMTGATGNIYAGLHEFRDMAFVVHLLRSGDMFFDVGANVGSYSVLAAGVAGSNVVAFEPSAETFRHLNENVNLNGLQNLVRTIRSAVGAERGKVRFTTGHDTMNHMVANRTVENAEVGRTAAAESFVEVDLCPLDELADQNPLALKIDVEGFESAVLSGAGRLLESPQLKAILVEANEAADVEGGVHQTLLGHGFVQMDYDPFTRSLGTQATAAHENNGIYVRDVAFVGKRLRDARPFKVLNRTI